MSKKISFQNYIKNTLYGEPELYKIYKDFKHTNISGYALTCVDRCAMSMSNTTIDGMNIKNNGMLSVSPIKDSTITTIVKGSIQSDLNGNDNDEKYKLHTILFFVPQIHKINGITNSGEIHIIFKQETDNEKSKWQINCILFNDIQNQDPSNLLAIKLIDEHIYTNIPNTKNKETKISQKIRWQLNDLLPKEQSYYSYIYPTNDRVLVVVYEKTIDVYSKFIEKIKSSVLSNISTDYWDKTIQYTDINQSNNIALFYTSDVLGTYTSNEDREKKMNDYCDTREGIKESLSSKETHYKTNESYPNFKSIASGLSEDIESTVLFSETDADTLTTLPASSGDDTPQIVDGSINNISINHGGTKYKVNPIITIGSPPKRIKATAIATINSTGGISSITIKNAGSGYTKIPEITITPPNKKGIAATAEAVLNNNGTGSIQNIKIIHKGSNYSVLPVISILPPENVMVTRATATTVIKNGVITDIILTQKGSGYLTQPPVTIESSSPGGTVATANAVISTEKYCPGDVDPYPNVNSAKAMSWTSLVVSLLAFGISLAMVYKRAEEIKFSFGVGGDDQVNYKMKWYRLALYYVMGVQTELTTLGGMWIVNLYKEIFPKEIMGKVVYIASITILCTIGAVVLTTPGYKIYCSIPFGIAGCMLFLPLAAGLGIFGLEAICKLITSPFVWLIVGVVAMYFSLNNKSVPNWIFIVQTVCIIIFSIYNIIGVCMFDVGFQTTYATSRAIDSTLIKHGYKTSLKLNDNLWFDIRDHNNHKIDGPPGAAEVKVTYGGRGEEKNYQEWLPKAARGLKEQFKIVIGRTKAENAGSTFKIDAIKTLYNKLLGLATEIPKNDNDENKLIENLKDNYNAAYGLLDALDDPDQVVGVEGRDAIIKPPVDSGPLFAGYKTQSLDKIYPIYKRYINTVNEKIDAAEQQKKFNERATVAGLGVPRTIGEKINAVTDARIKIRHLREPNRGGGVRKRRKYKVTSKKTVDAKKITDNILDALKN